MFLLTLILTILAGMLAKKEYENGRIEWAMFWSLLLGWDIHVLISSL
jgi:hypothetical protein